MTATGPRRNEHGQPIGPAVAWVERPAIEPVRVEGRYCRLEPLTAAREPALAEQLIERSPVSIWTYLPVGPFADRDGLSGWFAQLRAAPDAVPHAILDASGTSAGVASYLRLDAANGSVEVGGIVYSARLQRTTAATEAMYLMMRHAFDELGYRRLEWKCDSLNAGSRRAAERLGFAYEGTFRNAMVYKGRSRDTDWLSVTDADWPRVRERLETWLSPSNFDRSGAQRRRLA